MWIKNSNKGTVMMRDLAISDKAVKFVNGKAQVSEEVGRRFAEKYDTIEVVEPRRKKKTSTLNGTITKADSEDIAGATGTVVRDNDENISLTEDKS